MNAVIFDTLKLAKRLEAAGFSSQQAMGASEAIAESIGDGGGLATKEDLVAVKTELKADFSGLKTEFTGLKTEVQRLDIKISETKAELLKWMMGALAAQTAFLTAIKFFTH